MEKAAHQVAQLKNKMGDPKAALTSYPYESVKIRG